MIKYTLYIGLNDRDTEVSLDINKSLVSLINILKIINILILLQVA